MIKKLVYLRTLPIIREIDPTGTHKMTQNAESVMDNINSDRPDVIFLDIEMPDINGIDLARMITKKFPDMNIIFISE